MVTNHYAVNPSKKAPAFPIGPHCMGFFIFTMNITNEDRRVAACISSLLTESVMPIHIVDAKGNTVGISNFERENALLYNHQKNCAYQINTQGEIIGTEALPHSFPKEFRDGRVIRCNSPIEDLLIRFPRKDQETTNNNHQPDYQNLKE